MTLKKHHIGFSFMYYVADIERHYIRLLSRRLYHNITNYANMQTPPVGKSERKGLEFMVKEIHCDLCHCPKELWEPLKSYPSDNSCAFYSDVFDAAWDIEEEIGFVTYGNLIQRCYSFKEEYPDIDNFDAAVQECYSIFKETGVVKSPLEALRSIY